jgi:hypothetical protein
MELLIFTPASFGCVQMLVWLAKMRGKILLEINFWSTGTNHHDPWPPSRRMIGPHFFGCGSRKWLAYMKNVSWVIKPECNMVIFTSGESLKASL